MNLRKFSAALLAVAMVGSLAACGSKNSSSSSASSSSAVKLDADQTLTIDLRAEPSTMDPNKCSDFYGITVLMNTMENLTRLEENKDGTNTVKPAGAKSWETNADGTVWTFHLRGNKWSDGKAVTAQDYEYGIKRVLDPKVGSQLSYMLTPIKNAEKVNSGKLPLDQLGVKATDDKTLEITLERKTPYFLALTYSNSMFPCREDYVTKYGEKYGSDVANLVSNGPFTISNWVHNSQIIIKKNPDYWDKKSVKLETVNYKILTDNNAVYNSFDNGELDVLSNCTVPEWVKRFNAKSGVKEAEYTQPSTEYMFYNCKNKLFSNVHVRRAFTLAIDREEIVKTIYHGVQKAAYSWIPPGVSSGDLGDYRDQVKSEPVKELAKKYTDAKAELLAGMKELGLGSDPSTLKVTFSLGGTSQVQRDYAEYLQQTFQKVLGVQFDIDYNEWPTFVSKVNSGDYQMADEVWTVDYNDPDAMLSIMTSTSTAVPTNWKDSKFDALVKEAEAETDEAKRVQLYKQAEDLFIIEDTVLTPVTNRVNYRFNRNYVKNLTTNYFAENSSSLKYVYISGRK